jgi:hypothetical protein
MAGVKVTDLPVLAAAADNDVMYIVDTSDNLSKQIALSDVRDSIGLVSGTYLPVVIATSGAVLSASPVNGFYTVLGDIATVTIRGTANLDFSASSGGIVDVSLPVAIGSGFQIIGTLSIQSPKQFTGIVLENGALNFLSSDASAFGLAISFCAVMQYKKP